MHLSVSKNNHVDKRVEKQVGTEKMDINDLNIQTHQQNNKNVSTKLQKKITLGACLAG